MRLRFLWVGKTKDPLFSEIEERYLKRLERFIPTRRTWVPELKKLDARQKDTQLEREANRIEDKLPSRGYLVVLDQLGEELTSKGLAFFRAGTSQPISARVDLLGGRPSGYFSKNQEHGGPSVCPYETHAASRISTNCLARAGLSNIHDNQGFSLP